MRIINIVDRLDRINFGIWNASIATAGVLKTEFGVDSEIWFPQSTREAEDSELNDAVPRGLERLDLGELERVEKEARLDPSRDIIISHGCWQYPTRWGRTFKKKGYAWMAVPHGMLEQWSVSQKRVRKWIYFNTIEKPFLRKADKIRAVGRPELDSLKRVFKKDLVWMPNGVPSLKTDRNVLEKPLQRVVLFMARLHHKKGIIPLLEAWRESALCGRDGYRLVIAGPDDGELGNLKRFLQLNDSVGNIEYVGPVYGEKKEKLLRESHFYILPSFSEGFPTSVLEAMLYGLVPLISRGCNFPDVFEQKLGLEVSTEVAGIKPVFNRILEMDPNTFASLSESARDYIESNYTYEILAAKQFEFYKRLLKRQVA